jgi:dipeptidyl aminopeptidase/acylaminoacyl peptidase
MVAGDGTGDALLTRDVAGVTPEWRPGNRHELAYARPGGNIELVATDERRNLWRSGAGEMPTQLAWSADGRRLLALAPGKLRLFDAHGRLLSTARMPSSTRAETAAFGPSGHGFALVSQAVAAGRSRLSLVLLEPGARSQRRLLAGAGRFGEVDWSPDGRWLLLSWPDADQWVFIRTATGHGQVESLRAVSNISSQFDPGSGPGAAFPKLRGWCCAR